MTIQQKQKERWFGMKNLWKSGYPDMPVNGEVAVSVTGGGTAIQALDSASLSGNTITFAKTDASPADTIDLATTTLAGSATTNATAIATNIADISALQTNTTINNLSKLFIKVLLFVIPPKSTDKNRRFLSHIFEFRRFLFLNGSERVFP